MQMFVFQPEGGLVLFEVKSIREKSDMKQKLFTSGKKKFAKSPLTIVTEPKQGAI